MSEEEKKRERREEEEEEVGARVVDARRFLHQISWGILVKVWEFFI